MATGPLAREVRTSTIAIDCAVGGDTWCFYFDPDTAALVGCRLYQDETVGDGEYPVFDGVVESDGLRLPRHRSWYVNAGDRFLGVDELGYLEVGP